MNINTSIATKDKRYKCRICGRKRYFKYLRYITTTKDTLGCHRIIDVYHCKTEVSSLSRFLRINKCIARGSEDNLPEVKMS